MPYITHTHTCIYYKWHEYIDGFFTPITNSNVCSEIHLHTLVNFVRIKKKFEIEYHLLLNFFNSLTFLSGTIIYTLVSWKLDDD